LKPADRPDMANDVCHILAENIHNGTRFPNAREVKP
jgi:hypothetical protein